MVNAKRCVFIKMVDLEQIAFKYFVCHLSLAGIQCFMSLDMTKSRNWRVCTGKDSDQPRYQPSPVGVFAVGLKVA